jgi:hypothetical protein
MDKRVRDLELGNKNLSIQIEDESRIFTKDYRKYPLDAERAMKILMNRGLDREIVIERIMTEHGLSSALTNKMFNRLQNEGVIEKQGELSLYYINS